MQKNPGVFLSRMIILAMIFSLAFFTMPFASHAADDDDDEGEDGLEVAGWIPYWRDSEGIRDARRNIDSIDTVHPFVFTIKSDGTLNDLADLSDSEWKRFMKTAKSNDVEVIPTVMSSDGTLTHRLLSDKKLRTKHINAIVSMVKKGKYDGVDIDYEAKLSETKDFFSLFLTELEKALGSKKLTCTVEARTPPDSLYKVIPTTINYANDYAVIGKVCDRVEIMAYDQQRADIKLNEAKAGQPYMPVSDTDWVEKVVALAVKSIPKEKIMLGIATYGHHYEVTVSPNWYQNYRRIGALNLPDMLDVAEEYDATPSRNRAGEMSFTYIPKSSDLKLSKSLDIPKNTPKGNTVAARALAYANMTGQTVKFNMGWFSDAEAVEEKIDLAKKYGLRGIALFKIDGEEDRDIWDLLEE